jgi:DNA-binding transcriptional ArsR family regulator
MAAPKRQQTGIGPILPGDVPVEMPELPPRLAITTVEQFKAISDSTRSRILGIIQQQPATAKQIADRLGASPGTIGHHLQVLEDAGLAHVVARRLVRGIVAKYYTRTARIFTFDLPPEVTGDAFPSLEILSAARDELAEALASRGDDKDLCVGFPHARLAPERARAYEQRLNALMDEFLSEPTDSQGQVYGLATVLFLSPPYLQVTPQVTPPSHSAPAFSPPTPSAGSAEGTPRDRSS